MNLFLIKNYLRNLLPRLTLAEGSYLDTLRQSPRW